MTGSPDWLTLHESLADRLAALLLAILLTVAIPAFAVAETWRVKDGFDLNARSGPGTEHRIVETLPSGTIVEELGRDGSWSRVRTPGGNVAFVHNGYLVPPSASPAGRRSAEGRGAGTPEWQVALDLGHSAGVAQVVFSPDGQKIATASLDGTVRLWDAGTGRELKVLGGHEGRVFGADFSPDGQTIAISGWVSNDFGTARTHLHDVDSGLELRALQVTGDLDQVFSVSWSPDGSRLAVGGGYGDQPAWFSELQLVDAKSGALVCDLMDVFAKAGPVHFDRIGLVYRIAFSPDGTKVGAIGQTGMGLWSADCQRVLLKVSGEGEDRVESVAFSPAADQAIATGTADGRLVLLNPGGGSGSLELSAHEDAVLAVAFGPDGRTVATGAADGTLRLWDARTGEALHELDGHEDAILSVAFSPDGRSLATASRDSTVFLWDPESGRMLREVAGNAVGVAGLAFGARDSQLMASGQMDGTARLWNARSGTQLLTLEGHAGPVLSVAFSPESRAVLTGSADRTARLWDARTGRQLRAIEGHHETPVVAVDFSPDGKVMATGSVDGTVWLWDVASGSKLRKLAIPFLDSERTVPRLKDIEFSPNGKTVAVTGASIGSNFVFTSATHFVFDAGSGALEYSYTIHARSKTDLAFGPDGQKLAVVTDTGSVVLADAGTGRELRQLMQPEGDSSRIDGIAFAPDGGAVAVGLADGSTRLLNVRGEREPHVLEGQVVTDGEVAFGLGGRIIARGSADGTVRLWNARTGGAAAQFVSFADGSWVALTPEGFFNASEGAARNLHLSNGLETLSLDQFHDALYRPDLVREALAGDPDGKVAAAAARLDLGKAVASGLPPEVVGLRSLDGESVAGDVATMSVDIEPRDGGIGRVEWRVNGIVQGADSRGLGGLAVSDDGILRRERQVLLSPGENVVSVTVYNEANLIASTPLETTVHSSWRSVSPPSLHVLAAGVNDYWDGRLQLNYAVSDARALGSALRKAGRGLYEDVKITYLLDEEVTRDGLSAAFDRLAGEIRPQDAFVLFLAGHGTTHDGRYFFLPRDFRYAGEDALKDTAISQELLQGWLAGVPAQKSLLLFDTCESGSLTRELTTRSLEEKAAIARLSRAVGRTTLTASTDTAPALEGHRQHGLFTYVLLEALAASDTDGDDQVEITELIGYVDERLPALTEAVFGYRQVPQHRSQGSVFPIGRPVTVLPETEELIPRTPTHVVIAGTDVIESLGDLQSVLETVAPGTTVRVAEQADGWSLVAVQGVRLGWIRTASLAELR